MHVFIDTNIFLSFFHFPKDDLDSLENVFASHVHGPATVHLTQQVCYEFKRNRENKIKDALKHFKESKFEAQLPPFMKAYGEYEDIINLSKEIQKKQKEILKSVHISIAEKNLQADQLIDEIFENSNVIPTTPEVYGAASMRMDIGNPPGKNGSIGDAINWIVLLNSVPKNNDLHIVSADGDFYSSINSRVVNPFLSEEWNTKKNSTLFIYRTLSEFTEEHFNGVAFSYDKDKEILIDNLKYAGSFAVTHGLIARLEEYKYFSLNEVNKILKAAVANEQFGWIVEDIDVSDFLNRVAVPHMASITSESYKTILQSVLDKQKEHEEGA